jgi:hypothetical protein
MGVFVYNGIELEQLEKRYGKGTKMRIESATKYSEGKGTWVD